MLELQLLPLEILQDIVSKVYDGSCHKPLVDTLRKCLILISTQPTCPFATLKVGNMRFNQSMCAASSTSMMCTIHKFADYENGMDFFLHGDEVGLAKKLANAVILSTCCGGKGLRMRLMDNYPPNEDISSKKRLRRKKNVHKAFEFNLN